MGLFGRFRGGKPLPVDLIPEDLVVVEPEMLAAHTAESIVAVTIGVGDVDEVRARIRGRHAFALRHGETTVVFLPLKEHASPAFDPNTGWIVPVTAEVAEEIDRDLRPVVGGYQLSGTNLGFIVEEPAQ